jgi:hypothetical protein
MEVIIVGKLMLNLSLTATESYLSTKMTIIKATLTVAYLMDRARRFIMGRSLLGLSKEEKSLKESK